jgi:hypothetical protein
VGAGEFGPGRRAELALGARFWGRALDVIAFLLFFQVFVKDKF